MREGIRDRIANVNDQSKLKTGYGNNIVPHQLNDDSELRNYLPPLQKSSRGVYTLVISTSSKYRGTIFDKIHYCRYGFNMGNVKYKM